MTAAQFVGAIMLVWIAGLGLVVGLMEMAYQRRVQRSVDAAIDEAIALTRDA